MTTTEKWWESPMLGFDLESTSPNPLEARIVTGAVVHLKPSERPRTLSWVIDPKVEIPTDASDIHGWTAERIAAYRDARNLPAKDPAQGVFEMAGQVALAMSLGVPVVVFNGAYDLTLLETECRRHGVPTLTERLAPQGIRGVVDTYVIDKKFSRRKNKCTCGCGAQNRKLSEQIKHYKVILAGAHDAGADALAAARLVPRMVAAYPELAGLSLRQLHDRQIGWRREQCNSLRAYFDRVGTVHDGIPGDWPLIPAPADVAAEQGALI